MGCLLSCLSDGRSAKGRKRTTSQDRVRSARCEHASKVEKEERYVENERGKQMLQGTYVEREAGLERSTAVPNGT